MRSGDIFLWAVLIAAMAASPASVHAINYDETIDGDLSNSGNSPTQLNLSAGTNSVIATMPGADLDFLTVNIPVDHVFSGLTLVSYVSTDGTSFIGMKNGTTIAVTGNPADLNGYTHFGTGPGNVGQDILDDIGMGFGSVGFTPPLTSGAYSFWIQQASSVNVSYQFDFIVAAVTPPGLDGDFNGDNEVSAADYALWRSDPSSYDGAQGYTDWLNNFGASVGSGSAAIARIPEPSSLLLLGWLVVIAVVSRRTH